MEWMLLAVGTGVVVALGIWRVRGSRRGEGRPHPAVHPGPRPTPGIEDSMSVRLPTGGNSGA